MSIKFDGVSPQFFFKELIGVVFNFKQDVHGLFFELNFSLELRNIIREVKTFSEVNIIKPLFEIVHGEAESAEELSVLVLGKVHVVHDWRGSLTGLRVNVEFVVEYLNVHDIAINSHIHGGDHLQLIVDQVSSVSVEPGHANGVLKDHVSVELSESNINILHVKVHNKRLIGSKLFLEQWDLTCDVSACEIEIINAKHFLH